MQEYIIIFKRLSRFASYMVYTQEKRNKRYSNTEKISQLFCNYLNINVCDLNYLFSIITIRDLVFSIFYAILSNFAVFTIFVIFTVLSLRYCEQMSLHHVIMSILVSKCYFWTFKNFAVECTHSLEQHVVVTPVLEISFSLNA